MKVLGAILGVILLLAIMYLIASGVWWVVLWSFNFPIVFAWKQTIGVFALSLLIGGSCSTNK